MRHPLSSFPASVETPGRQLVAGIIIRDRKVLLVENIKHGCRIEPPGGKVQEGETREAALIRECMEELGILVQTEAMLGVYETHSPEGVFPVHMFRCSLTQGEPQKGLEPGKIGDILWLSREELLALDASSGSADVPRILVPNVRAALQEIVRCMEDE